MKRNHIISVFSIFVLASAVTAFAYRVTIREKIAEANRPALPEARPYVPPAQTEPLPNEEATSIIEEEVVAVPPKVIVPTLPEKTEDPSKPKEDTATDSPVVYDEMNLAIPFSSQAPNADWSLPFQEACEETSLIMVNAWMVGTPAGVLDPNTVERLIRELVSWQEERFGYYEDTTAEETATIAREFYGYKNTVVLPVRSIEDIKNQLSAGYAVILPASGHDLHNPYFSGNGPLYHMLVAKGFTKDGDIITNDPGTKRGQDFIYDADALFNALGDWNGGNPSEGAKLMIILKI